MFEEINPKIIDKLEKLQEINLSENEKPFDKTGTPTGPKVEKETFKLNSEFKNLLKSLLEFEIGREQKQHSRYSNEYLNKIEIYIRDLA